MEGLLLVSRIILLFLNYGLWVVCAAITNFYVVFVDNVAVLMQLQLFSVEGLSCCTGDFSENVC